jgi:hypothetical protein
MNEPPRQLALIDDFVGMFSDVDPDDIPMGGSRLQINVGCIRQGELVTRHGLKECAFDVLTFPTIVPERMVALPLSSVSSLADVTFQLNFINAEGFTSTGTLASADLQLSSYSLDGEDFESTSTLADASFTVGYELSADDFESTGTLANATLTSSAAEAPPAGYSVWLKADGTNYQDAGSTPMTDSLAFKRLLDSKYQDGIWMGVAAFGTPGAVGGGVQETFYPYGIFVDSDFNSFHILISRRSGASHFINIDGGTEATNSVGIGVTATNAQALGCSSHGSPADFFGGYIAEVVEYESNLSSGDRTALIDYLKAKWGIA